MQHAGKLIDRILFLNGKPSMDKLGKINIGKTVKEILASDLELERKAIKDLNSAIDAAGKACDHITITLLENILEQEEAHVEHLEKQLHLYSSLGEQNYLQLQVE